MVAKDHTEISFEERKTLEDLLRKKFSWSVISTKMNRSRNCLSKEVIRRGFRLDTYDAEKAHQHALMCKQSRKEKLKHQITPYQDQKIREGFNQGLSASTVRNSVGISRARFDKWLDQNPEFQSLVGGKSIDMLQRIETLEEQLKLLSELVKELYERNQ